jgi:predicted phage terminase large subunit-like protein
LDGDWDTVADGNLFRREFFTMTPTAQPCDAYARHWDLAATAESDAPDPDWTAGVLMGRRSDGRLVVTDVVRLRASPGEVEATVRRTAVADRERFGPGVRISVEQEPGSAGAALVHHYATRVLAGFAFRGVRPTGDKVTRALPFVAQAEAGNVIVVEAHWTNDFINELVAFPTAGVHDDQVDAASGAFAELVDATDYEFL